MPRPLVIYIGVRTTGEFAAPLEWLHQRVALTTAENLDSGCILIQSSPVPFDIIVVGQTRTGEHANAGFERLRALSPLTPIVSLVGSWCEGQARTGKPWRGAVRVYAHQFVPRVGSQLAELARSSTMSWSPPFTATDEDRLLAAPPWPVAAERKRVAVVAKRRETAAALCDALARTGYDADCISAHTSEVIRSRDLLIWDCPAGFAESRNSFVELTRRLPGIPWIVLVTFPRSDDQAELVALGAAAVISKPFLLEDLLAQVRACLQMV